MTDKTKKILKITAAIVLPFGTGALVYAVFIRKTKTGVTLWDKWTSKDNTNKTPPDNTSKPPVKTPAPAASTNSSGFPIKLGDTGQLVKDLQKGLVAMQGDAALPKGGIDGIFGQETLTALKKAGYNSPVSQTDYNQIKAWAGADGNLSRSEKEYGVSKMKNL